MRQKLPQNFPFTDNFVLNINFIYAVELLKYFQKRNFFPRWKFVFFSNLEQSDHNGY